MKINIQWQDQHGHWKHFQTKHYEADAYRTAKRRAESTKKRHRLTSESGSVMDLIDPQ